MFRSLEFIAFSSLIPAPGARSGCYHRRMLDEELRRGVKPFYQPLADVLVRSGATGNLLTGMGLGIGILCLAFIAIGYNVLGLILWLLNRLLDGLDGEVARLRGETSELGTFLDITADFFMYGGFLVALAVQHPDSRLALVVLFFAYYMNGSVFLAFSGILNRVGAERLTERGLHFRRSLTEGFETILAGVIFLALSNHVSLIAWIFAAMVFVSAVQRLHDGLRVLKQVR